MSYLTKREIMAVVGSAVLSAAVAVMAILQMLNFAIALLAVQLGLVGILLVLSGASVKNKVVKLTARRAREIRRVATDIKTYKLATEQQLDAVSLALKSLDQQVDSLRFSQSVLLQGISTTKGLTQEATDLTRSTQLRIDELANASANLADDLASAFLAVAEAEQIPSQKQ